MLDFQRRLYSPTKRDGMLHLQSKLRRRLHMMAFHAVYELQDRGRAGLPCGRLEIVEVKKHRPVLSEQDCPIAARCTDRLNQGDKR